MALTLLMVTYNRLEYTQQAVTALLESGYRALDIVIWDNASNDETRPWLVSQLADNDQVTLILSNRNTGTVHPMNVVWGGARTPLVAKVDNDTLIPPDLLSRLADCLASYPQLGVISGCHYRPEDMQNPVNPALNTVYHDTTIGISGSLLRRPHVGGCAVMMRGALFKDFGSIACTRLTSDGPYLESGWTDYQHRLHRAGYVNGYPLPLIYVDHMEDTRSPNHLATTEHENYKQAMRGHSLADCTERFYIHGARRTVQSGEIELLGVSSPDDLEPEGVTLFVPLAGRRECWPQLAHFLDHQQWSHEHTKLILLDTSQDESFFSEIKDWVSASDYPGVCLIRQTVGAMGLADEPRREATTAVKAAMAKIYNLLRRLVQTEYVWIVEDDILPTNDVCAVLLSSMEPQTASVAAPYRSRFGDRYVVWDRSGRNYTRTEQGVTEVGGNGFGCVLIRSGILKTMEFDPNQDCDRYFYSRLAETHWTARVDWSCSCQHGFSGGAVPEFSNKPQ